MSVVAFYTCGKDQTGNTASAISLATYMGIVQNKRVLFISTALNNSEIKKALWPTQTVKKGLFGMNTNYGAGVNDNGIEGLDRIIRSNRISPDIITDYTRVALKGRLEILQGYNGSEEQYKEIQKQYMQIISLAKQIYDTVIVDIDKELEAKTKLEILNGVDIVVAMATQKIDSISNVIRTMAEGVAFKKSNSILTIGKYDDKSKYNAKNISRNILRTKDIINTVPYNTILFEEMQEGRLIDMFLRFLNLGEKDENTFFVDEIKRLKEDIDKKEALIRQVIK